MTLPQLMKMRDDALRLSRYHEREVLKVHTYAELGFHFALIDAYRFHRVMVEFLVNKRRTVS